MTEAEWMQCPEATTMLDFVQPRASIRKLRLFACGCCRRLWDLMENEAGRKVVDIAERVANRSATARGMAVARAAAKKAAETSGSLTDLSMTWCAYWSAAPNPTRKRALSAARYAAHHAIQALAHAHIPGPTDSWREWHQQWQSSKTYQEDFMLPCTVLRDIFGPLPFRRISLGHNWLTWNDQTTVRLAEAIYTARTFERLPILADALEEAGCDNAEMLNHCRQPFEHVRGCWLLDLLLGKE